MLLREKMGGKLGETEKSKSSTRTNVVGDDFEASQLTVRLNEATLSFLKNFCFVFLFPDFSDF